MIWGKIVLLTVWILFFLQAGGMAETKTVATDDEGITLFLAGDALITQPWSHLTDPQFLRLVDEIRGADVAIVNLETLIHEYKGYAQAHSGGAYMTSPPKIAFELDWAGVDMVAHANNHTFDYGSIGVLENLEHTAKAGLVLAGSGKDLQNALAPRYFKHPKGTVGLVSASSTFHDYGRASNSRPDFRGRPGLNPLTLHKKFLSGFVTITPSTASLMQKFSRALGFRGRRFSQERFYLMGMQVKVGDEHAISFGRGGYFDLQEMEANIASVREAKSHANVVVFAIHAHRQGLFLHKLAREIIDAGADVFLAHGPHEIKGIEFYKDKPIFYSLGDFVFQGGLVERFPADVYESYGLDKNASIEELRETYLKRDKFGFLSKREPWEGMGVLIRFNRGKVTGLKLLPVDLGFQKSFPILGRPKYADPVLGKYLIEYAAKQSRDYRTQIQYVKEGNFGRVNLR